jgi:hypothetical protein
LSARRFILADRAGRSGEATGLFFRRQVHSVVTLVWPPLGSEGCRIIGAVFSVQGGAVMALRGLAMVLANGLLAGCGGAAYLFELDAVLPR